MMCISLFSYGRPVVVRCKVVGWVGLGHGSISSPGSGLGWVMLGQLFGGLGWAGSMKIDPRTTLLAGLTLCHETRSCYARHHNDLEGHSNFSSTICSFSILCFKWNITTVEINRGVHLLKS